MSGLIIEVCRVEDAWNHPDADRLDLIKVKGWQCIVGRDELTRGDLVVFIPPDSILPPEFIERFDISYLKGKRGRVGTVKLRGEYSEGLVIPNVDKLPNGANVAEYYGITKWEPPEDRRKQGIARQRRIVKAFKRYTDIENIKHFQELLEYKEPVFIVEKVHGTNVRAGWVKRESRGLAKFVDKLMKKTHDFHFGSRKIIVDNSSAKVFYDTNVYATIAERYNLKEVIPHDYIVYGEIYGKKIQDLQYGLDGIDVVFFDVRYEGEYLDLLEAYELLEEWGLPQAPLLYAGPWDLKLISKYSIGMSELDPYMLREGFVVRPEHERHNNRVGRVIFKAISQAYLTRRDGTERH